MVASHPTHASPAQAPAWLTALRATDEWRQAHTARDEHGRVVVPVFPWAETASNAAGPAGRSFLRFVQWLGERYGPRVALADYSRVKFAGYGAAPDTPPSLTTYSELAALIQRRAAWLRTQGVGPWQRLALCLPNSREVLALQYAAWAIGALVTPINMAQRDRARVLLQGTIYHRIFVDREPAAFAAELGVDPARVVDVYSERFRAAVAAQPATVTLEQPPVFDDPVLILSTSGTTGRPKGAMLSAAGLLIGSLALQEGFALAAADRFLLVNPLYHINSIAFSLALLGVGARIVVPPFGFHWDVAVRDRITTSSMVQRHLTPVLNPVSPGDQRNAALFQRLREGGTLKWIAVGSGPLAPEVQERLLDLGVLVLFRWGMSENYLGSTNMRPGYPLDYYRARLSSTGPTNRYLELLVLDDAGRPQRTGRGRLMQRGNILVAYDRPEDNAGAFAGGYHDTGDIAEITVEGHVYIVGRSKETIIRSGENIYPQEVDNYLMKHPAVIFAQTVGFPDPDHSEEVGAFAVVSPDAALPERKLQTYVAALGAQQRPKQLVLLSPRGEQGFFRYTGPGKAQRRHHQRLFWQMYCLDRAVPLLVADGLLPEGARGYAVPDGPEVGLLLLLPGDGAAVSGELRERLGSYLARAGRLPGSEHRRWLAAHDCSLDSLLPSQMHSVPLVATAAREIAALNRAQLYERFWPEPDSQS